MMLTDTNREILLLCYYDYTGLWQILKTICKEDYSIEKIPNWARKQTIEVINDLLREELIEAGFVDQESHKFISFKWSPNETLNFIEKQWDQLGRVPNIGDICDFFVTFKGKKLVKDLEWDIS